MLVEGNQPWTANAPVLALGIYDRLFTRNDKPNKAAAHDLGAASAMLTLEATARGLVVHQMIGIEPEQARVTFALEERLEPFTALAIGYDGDGARIGNEPPSAIARPASASRLASFCSKVTCKRCDTVAMATVGWPFAH